MLVALVLVQSLNSFRMIINGTRLNILVRHLLRRRKIIVQRSVKCWLFSCLLKDGDIISLVFNSRYLLTMLHYSISKIVLNLVVVKVIGLNFLASLTLKSYIFRAVLILLLIVCHALHLSPCLVSFP